MYIYIYIYTYTYIYIYIYIAPLAAAEGGQPWAGQPDHQRAHLYGGVGPDDVSEEGCVPLDVAMAAVADSDCGPASSSSMRPSTTAVEAALMMEAVEEKHREAAKALRHVLATGAS